MRFATACGLLILATTAARAVPAEGRGPLAELVPPVHGRKACFVRVYDAAHLRDHPAQRVTSMALGLRYHRHPPEARNPQGQRNTYFTLTTTVKGERRRLVSSGECGTSEGLIGCSVECDGGGFGLKREPGGSVVLDLMTVNGRLRMTRGCGGEEDDTVELTPGADDRTFRLAPAPESACRK